MECLISFWLTWVCLSYNVVKNTTLNNIIQNTMELTRDNAGANLRSFREKFGKTLDQVREKTGVSNSTLIAIEKGGKPQALTIYKLNEYIKKVSSGND